ncbi:hypothetical protein AURDEDRAFT_126326 [Auricularia subglabra TFB-10046 SS5]|nr:hypothetical protein AURDEDRAFT_126326 [Auricularia subglabra TFB-10046 SS5]
MPPGPFIAALAAQGAETAGSSDAKILLGTADQIVASATIALADSARDMSSVVSSVALDAERTDLHQVEAFAKFGEILEEIRSFVETQKERSYLSALLHQQRDKGAISQFSDRLNDAFDALMTSLKIQASVAVAARAADLAALFAKRTVQLPAVSTLPTPIYPPIPPAPQLHFGRATETQAVVDAITQTGRAGRLAILGGPGIGKTALAAAVLHDPAVAERFGARRFFVRCDGAEGRPSCLATIADAFGIAAASPSAALRGLKDALAPHPAVLRLDNMPLALVITASLAQYTPLSDLIAQWDETATAMLVRGATSVDVSINMSLHSPRMQSVPEAQNLLSVLALLPSGAMDTDIYLWAAEIVRRALPALLRTALATRSTDGRIHVLAPIRSFMCHYHPPSGDCVSSATVYYCGLAGTLRNASGRFEPETLALLAPELANIHSVARFSLETSDSPGAALEAAKHLGRLYLRTGTGSGPELLPLACSTAERHGLDEARAGLLALWCSLSFNGVMSGNPFSLSQEAYNIFERTGNAEGMITSGRMLFPFLPAPRAIAELRKLYRLAEALGDSVKMAACAQTLARALARDGQFLEAITQDEHAITLVQQDPTRDDHVLIGTSLQRMGLMYLNLGNGALAFEKHQQALAIFEQAPFRTAESVVHMQLCGMYLLRGQPLEAIEHASKAIEVHRGAEFRHKASCLMLIAHAHILSGSEAAAINALDEAGRLVSPGSHSHFERAELLRAHGILAHRAGNLRDASAFLRAAAYTTVRNIDSIRPREDMMRSCANSLIIHSGVEQSGGQLAQAAVYAIAAAVLFRRLASGMECARCLVSLCDVVDDAFAKLLLRAVITPLLRVGDAACVSKAFLRIAIIAFGSRDRRLARHCASRALRRLQGIRDKTIIFRASLIISNCT